MTLSHLKMVYNQGEKAPPNLFTDHDWIRDNRESLLAQYGECWVVVYQGRVIGTGDDYHTALEDAERRLPPDSDTITPICEWSGPRIGLAIWIGDDGSRLSRFIAGSQGRS